MNGKIEIDIYTQLCTKRRANENLLSRTGDKGLTLFVGHILTSKVHSSIFIRCRQITFDSTYTRYLE